MEEKIMAYMNRYLEEHPGTRLKDTFQQRSKRMIASYQKLADARGYSMDFALLDEGDFQLRLTSDQGEVYGTYVFKKAILAE